MIRNEKSNSIHLYPAIQCKKSLRHIRHTSLVRNKTPPIGLHGAHRWHERRQETTRDDKGRYFSYTLFLLTFLPLLFLIRQNFESHDKQANVETVAGVLRSLVTATLLRRVDSLLFCARPIDIQSPTISSMQTNTRPYCISPSIRSWPSQKRNWIFQMRPQLNEISNWTWTWLNLVYNNIIFYQLPHLIHCIHLFCSFKLSYVLLHCIFSNDVFL